MTCSTEPTTTRWVGWTRNGCDNWLAICSAPSESAAWNRVNELTQRDAHEDDDTVVLPVGVKP